MILKAIIIENSCELLIKMPLEENEFKKNQFIKKKHINKTIEKECRIYHN